MKDYKLDQQEEKEWNEYKAKRVPELQEILKKMEDDGEINNEYWHFREKYFLLSDPCNSLSSHYLGLMKLCVECVEHSKTVSPEILKRWMKHWECFVMDTTGDAHCVLRHPYYPQYWTPAEGQEKEEWEEIIELSYRFYDLYPKEEPTKYQRFKKWLYDVCDLIGIAGSFGGFN